jgi:hypothetical protein
MVEQQPPEQASFFNATDSLLSLRDALDAARQREALLRARHEAVTRQAVRFRQRLASVNARLPDRQREDTRPRNLLLGVISWPWSLGRRQALRDDVPTPGLTPCTHPPRTQGS